jgi:hypothetical protein
LVAFFNGLLDLLDHNLELALALERDRVGPPLGVYLAMSMHIEYLIEEIAPGVDAGVTAQLLLNAINPYLIRYLRREAGVNLATIKASLQPLIAGLAQP